MRKFSSLLIFVLLTLLISCEKCNVYYLNKEYQSSFMELDCELHDHPTNSSLNIRIRSLDLRNLYIDSINIYPIYKDVDTFMLQRKNNLNFQFDVNNRMQMDEIDVMVNLYSKDLSLRNDTCVFFRNLVRTRDCFTTTAFH